MKQKSKKEHFQGASSGTSGASLLGNLLTGKGIVTAGSSNKKGKGIVRASTGRLLSSASPHPLTNFEIQKYYKNEPRFNGVFSRNNLPKKIKDVLYVINLDEYADVNTHWIALFCNRNDIFYFDSFGVEHIPEEIKKFIEELSGNRNVKTNIF